MANEPHSELINVTDFVASKFLFLQDCRVLLAELALCLQYLLSCFAKLIWSECSACI